MTILKKKIFLRLVITDLYDVDKLPDDLYPLQYSTIDKYQQQDKGLLNKLRNNQYTTKTFCGGGKQRQLICPYHKIVIPKILR